MAFLCDINNQLKQKDKKSFPIASKVITSKNKHRKKGMESM